MISIIFLRKCQRNLCSGGRIHGRSILRKMTKKDRDIEITVINEQRTHRIETHAYKDFMIRLLKEAGAKADQISVLFTDDDRMRGFNRRFRKVNRSTDVIAFPDGEQNIEGKMNIGDIIISVPRAFRQARDSGFSLDREIKKLLVHGFLHLAGYDHEKDLGEMKKLEELLFKALVPP